MRYFLTMAGAIFALLACTPAGYTLTLDPTTDITVCGDVNPDVTNAVLNNNGCWVVNISENLDQDFTIGGNSATFLDKDEAVSDIGGGLTLSGDTQSGTWSIDSYDPTKDYLLVFKDGANALPGSQIAYLLDGSTGTYDTPFFNDLEGTSPKDISFFALFEVDGDGPLRTPRENPPTPVPLPAGILLMGTCIAAFGVQHRRQRRERV